jgi:methylenetetrahydrofolate reductase (NADPH)
MKVIDALKKGKPTLSFEFFPPKTQEQEARLFEVISQLKGFSPDFVSVTYGALGTTRAKSFFWVKRIKEQLEIEPVAHLTCVAASRKEMRAQLEELEGMGVKNILALRGDPPEEAEKFVPPADGFHFAKELVGFIKQCFPEVCLGVAGYPEQHPESPDPETDVQHLKEKINAGADYVVTQLFFDNKHYFDFCKRCRAVGISVPIIPGIMPITSLKQIKKMTEICGATIPAGLLEKLEKFESDQAVIEKIGVEQAVSQAKELREAKVPGLHFFVLNRSGPISRILRDLG